jgi:hypothetical protein
MRAAYGFSMDSLIIEIQDENIELSEDDNDQPNE